MNRQPFVPGEWYHCYSRGVDKRTTFTTDADFRRFQIQMYTSNSTTPYLIKDHTAGKLKPTFASVLDSFKRGDPIVHVGAYSLLRNHFHLLLMSDSAGAISSYMRRLLTGYTMYYNKKHSRTGTLFDGTFKSKHVTSDNYLRRLANYIHCNPAHGKSIVRARKVLAAYTYSSFPDYRMTERIESCIVDIHALTSVCAVDLSIASALANANDFGHFPEV